MGANIRCQVLSISFERSQFAFALWREPRVLYRYGRRRIVSTDTDASITIMRLLTRYAPQHVLLDRKIVADAKQRPECKTVLEMLHEEASEQHREIVFIPPEDVTQVFQRFGEPKPYTIAVWTAIFFPKLQERFSKLTRKTDDRLIFDAVSRGVAYFSRFGEYEIQLRAAA
jgi:hypothetical protein